MSSQSFVERMAHLSAATASIPRAWISELVLQTARFDEMKTWYESVLGGSWFHVNEPKYESGKKRGGDGGKQVHAVDVRAAFMNLETVPPYNVVLAIFELPWLDLAPTKDPGLNHIQFKHRDFEALFRRIEAMRDAELHPHRSANHGHLTSFYFRDPDENIVELCVENFATREEYAAYLASPAFRKNPSGIDIDRDAFIARYRSGIPRAELIRID